MIKNQLKHYFFGTYGCQQNSAVDSNCIIALTYITQSNESSLVFTKLRIAPIKDMVIQRLELLAILIGVRYLICY
ncbi:unnamed protein product [Brugia pahangi]|uniref:Uncharacterized protein n=1 Tax=Brugia pahangi TaxID=6280 RepID=A0A0N4T3D8_BRUPA|nr:unnamed protein product [Brugia pahangi]